MDMTCKKCVASEQHKSHEQAESQDLLIHSPVGFSCLCWVHCRTVLVPSGLCSSFESVHAGVAPRKLVDFFKCCLGENAAVEAERKGADETNPSICSNETQVNMNLHT